MTERDRNQSKTRPTMFAKPFIRSYLFSLLALSILASVTPPESRAEPTFVRKVIDFLGISASPGALKGAEAELLKAGDLWLARLDSGVRFRLTWDGGYRSPVFSPKDKSIVALKGDDTVRIAPSSGESKKLLTVPGIQKIVGFHGQGQNQILILLKDESAHSVAILSLDGGNRIRVPFDKDNGDDRRMLNHLLGWERVYNHTRIYVEGCNEGGAVQERTNVCLKREGKSPVNISQCGDANCGQPSLSPDHIQVVYVKAEK
jgi:hypothetical protein